MKYNEKENKEDGLPSIISEIHDEKNSKDVNFTNGYQFDAGTVNSYHVVEFGALKENPKQGVAVIKQISIKNDKILSEERVLMPEKHGAIRATDCNAYNISVVAEDGEDSWIFNVYDGFRHNDPLE